MVSSPHWKTGTLFHGLGKGTLNELDNNEIWTSNNTYYEKCEMLSMIIASNSCIVSLFHHML